MQEANKNSVDEAKINALPIGVPQFNEVVDQGLIKLIANFKDCKQNLASAKYDGFKDFTRDI